MFEILITIDYEIFGNGKGDVKKHIVNPTNKMMAIANKYGIPLVFMFEVYEYLVFKKYDELIKMDKKYSPAEVIADQMKRAYEMGHDIEMHIHPQFVDMYYEKGKFVIPYPTRQITDFRDEEIKRIIKKSKDTVIEVVGDKKYTPIALRLSNMPWDEAPKKVAKIMKELNIPIHSLALSSSPKNTERGFWKIIDGVYEFPILTIDTRKKITLRKSMVYAYLYVHGAIKIGKTSKGVEKWDLCKLTWKEMLDFIEYAKKIYDYENYNIPLIMIGHTKDFFNKNNFEKFLKKTHENYVSKGIAEFSTFREVYKKVIQYEQG